MNKFGKILACTLGAVTVAGAVGAVCYNELPAFKSVVDKALKINNSKANIGLDVKDTTPSNPNEIKPITPEEFKATYKIAVPNEFLGEYLYVKKLKNDNLLISSSVCTSILYYKKATNETKQIFLENKNWMYFEELDNGDVFMASSENNSGLLVFKAEDESVKKIYATNSIIRYSCKLSTGNYYIGMGANSGSLFVDTTTYKVECIRIDSTCFAGVIDLGGDKMLLGGKLYTGLYYYDHSTMTDAQQVYAEGNYLTELFRDDERVIMMVLTKEIISFSLEDLTVTPVFTGESVTNSSTTKVRYYGDNILLYGSFGLFKLDKSTCEYEKISSGHFVTAEFRKLKNGNELIFRYSNNNVSIYSLNTTTLESSLLQEIRGTSLYVEEYGNGDLFIGGLGNDGTSGNGLPYIYFFSNSTNTLKQLGYNSNGLGYIRLPNGKILALTTNSYKELCLFNPADCSYTLLCKFDSSASLSLVEQEDGTVLIETGEDIKYEYDYKTDTLRLVYVAEV